MSSPPAVERLAIKAMALRDNTLRMGENPPTGFSIFISNRQIEKLHPLKSKHYNNPI
jgi:hypothetical protein